MDRLADRFSTLTEDKMAAKVVPKVGPDEKVVAKVATKGGAGVVRCFAPNEGGWPAMSPSTTLRTGNF